MKVFHCDLFTYPLPPDHRFPAAKYGLLRQRVADALAPPCELLTPDAATDVELLHVHRPEYLEKVVSGTLTDREVRRIGLPWSPELVERSRRSVGGSIEPAAALDRRDRGQPGGRHAPHVSRSRRGVLHLQRRRRGSPRDAGRGAGTADRRRGLRRTPGRWHRGHLRGRFQRLHLLDPRGQEFPPAQRTQRP